MDAFKAEPSLTKLPHSPIEPNLESSLVQLIERKDESTFHHGNRVAELTSEWVRYMKLKNEWIELDEQDLVLSARLHDVGKVGVLTKVLNKAGPLDEDERAHLNLHVEIGYELVKDSNRVTEIALAVRHHHERWDGQGYPHGLQSHQIPFFAQIIGIVDAYDAMTSDRPYQKARSPKEAIAEIEKNAGRQFSPVLSQSFVEFLYARNT